MSVGSLNNKSLIYVDKMPRLHSTHFCKNCDIVTLKENFHYWTSGNPMIDEFIRHTQLNADENMEEKFRNGNWLY